MDRQKSNDNKQTYLKAVEQYFQAGKKDKNFLLDFFNHNLVTQRIETTFGEILFEKRKFTLNTFLWSFTYKEVMPIYPVSINLADDEYEDRRRKEYFEKFKEQLQRYSFTKAFVEDDIQALFHFRKPKLDKLRNYFKQQGLDKKDLEELTIDDYIFARTIGQKNRIFIKNDDEQAIYNFWKNQRIEPKEEVKKDFLATFKAGVIELIHSINEISNVYFIPVITGLGDKVTGGQFVINSDIPIEGKKVRFIQTYISGLFDEFQIQELDKLQQDTMKEKNEANTNFGAVSIISRNISHNLGSHTFTYLKNALRKTNDILEKDILNDVLIQKEDGTYKLNPVLESGTAPVKKHTQNNPNLPYLLGIGRFVGHIQERQDYIATIASNEFPYFSPINFKELVYDEFTYDKRAERHKDSHEKHRNILLEYIALSEGFTREDIVIKFRNFDGSIESRENYGRKDFEYLRSLDVSLPSGIMGRQAFYSILENVIRNTAKHGLGKEQREKLEITLDIEKEHDPKYNDRYYKMTITDNSGNTIEQVIENLRRIIAENIVDEEGKLKEQNKGVKEIQISAAWLLGIKPYDIKQKADIPPILSVEKAANGVCYTLYLKKPQLSCVITENKDLATKINALDFWKAYTYAEVEKEAKLYYRFAIIDENETYTEEQLSHIESKSTVCCMKYAIAKETISKSKQEALYIKICECWLEQQSGLLKGQRLSDMKITIVDGKTDTNNKGKIVAKGIQLLSTARASECDNSNIIYRTHNDTQTDFKQLKDILGAERYKKIKYIDGISGNNSTDRIVRREILNEHWRLKMIESALTKVLILDERIWANITNQNVKQKDKRSVLIENLYTIADHLESNSDIGVDLLNSTIKELENPIDKDDLEDYISKGKHIEIRKLAKQLQGNKQLSVDDTRDDSNFYFEYEKYTKKNIFIFNVRRKRTDADSYEFDIVDLRNKVVGTVSKEGIIVDESGQEMLREYDFVSVHQGIVDKIAKAQGKTITNVFQQIKERNIRAKRYLFHSGRSITNELPEGCAFIQYSSLENSLFDSKFTLTELLYSSIIEK